MKNEVIVREMYEALKFCKSEFCDFKLTEYVEWLDYLLGKARTELNIKEN